MYDKLPSTLHMYPENFTEPGLDDKLDGLEEDGTNVIEIFYRNYRDWVIWHNKAICSNQPIGSVVKKYDDKIQNGHPAFGPPKSSSSKLHEFANSELKYFSENVKLVLTIQQKENWKCYVNHIKENLWRYVKLDKVALYLNPNRKQKQIAELAKGKIDLGFVDIMTLEKDTHNVLTKADQMYFENKLSDLHPTPMDTYENIEETLNRYFKFDYYKNPIEYEEFPSEKITYLKTVKTWLTILLNKRKELMDLKQLPKPHQFIESYALSLVQSVNQPTQEQLLTIETSKIEVNQPINLSYPTHIFKDYKSYAFFWFIAQKLDSHAQLSFLFRTLHEKEKPQMIVAKDTPFRSWFNETDHPLKLESITKTYIKAANPDRIAMYDLLKELYFSN